MNYGNLTPAAKKLDSMIADTVVRMGAAFNAAPIATRRDAIQVPLRAAQPALHQQARLAFTGSEFTDDQLLSAVIGGCLDGFVKSLGVK